MTKQPRVYRGIGFFGVLTIVLIVLKLAEVISISWWWIVATFFAPWIIGFSIIAFGFMAVGLIFLGALILDLITGKR